MLASGQQLGYTNNADSPTFTADSFQDKQQPHEIAYPFAWRSTCVKSFSIKWTFVST